MPPHCKQHIVGALEFLLHLTRLRLPLPPHLDGSDASQPHWASPLLLLLPPTQPRIRLSILSPLEMVMPKPLLALAMSSTTLKPMLPVQGLKKQPRTTRRIMSSRAALPTIPHSFAAPKVMHSRLGQRSASSVAEVDLTPVRVRGEQLTELRARLLRALDGVEACERLRPPRRALSGCGAEGGRRACEGQEGGALDSVRLSKVHTGDAWYTLSHWRCEQPTDTTSASVAGGWSRAYRALGTQKAM
ncbi:hypothetical protein B0H10DRAFT_2247774 [Mycena sp. CBHHK59/15]|nr:hypothetical protein B0H10DRAFT_2247774 [Mycena sp. CBHHK59/15]